MLVNECIVVEVVEEEEAAGKAAGTAGQDFGLGVVGIAVAVVVRIVHIPAALAVHNMGSDHPHTASPAPHQKYSTALPQDHIQV